MQTYDTTTTCNLKFPGGRESQRMDKLKQGTMIYI